MHADHDTAAPTRDLIGYGRPGLPVTWPGNARLAICLVINYEEGSEYSFADGDGRNEIPQEFDYPPLPIRDLGNESIFEYGSRAGIWRLQRLLDSLQLPATFQGCAQAFERNPDVGAWIKEAGHDVCCHGYRWENVSLLDRETEAARMKLALESIEATCGHRPRGWYSRQPASVNTRELLVEDGGFLYDSDSFADDLPFFVPVLGKPHLVIPYSFTLNDGRFLPGQSYSGPEVFLDHCRRAFDFLWEEGAEQPKMMTIGLHPRIIGQPARAHALREFLLYALSHDGVWFTRRTDIAEWWLSGRHLGGPDATEEWPQRIATALLGTTASSRTTVRLLDQGGQLRLASEVCAPGVGSMQTGPQIDPTVFPTYRYLEETGQLLIQDDCSTAGIAPPPDLLKVHRVHAQMLAPLTVDGAFRGTISVHQQDAPRHWKTHDIAALTNARAQAEAALRQCL